MNDSLIVIQKEIKSLEPSFVGLTSHGDAPTAFKQECHYAVQAMQANEYLASTAVSNIDSLRNAILNVASTGLSLNPASRQAYLVPRNKKVCLDISYIGLVHLATEFGGLKSVSSMIVYEKDEFIYNGVAKEPTHKFKPFEDRGKPIGVYCVAVTRDDVFLTEMMSIADCHAIRNRTELWKSKQSGPWKTDESEMMKKTVVKRASKLWPKASSNSKLNEAISVVNEHEGIDFSSEVEEKPRILKEEKFEPTSTIIEVGAIPFKPDDIYTCNTVEELTDLYKILTKEEQKNFKDLFTGRRQAIEAEKMTKKEI
jgi:recombination protein RecT